MSEKTVRVLSLINAADIATGQIVEMVEKIFHVEDMFVLAKKNSFIALNFYQLVCNIDYCLLTPGDMFPVGAVYGEGLIGFGMDVLGVGGKSFKKTPQGTLAAVAECFRVQATKMDNMITIDVVSSFMQGTGAAQIAQDAVNALLQGGLMVAKEGAKLIPAAVAGL